MNGISVCLSDCRLVLRVKRDVVGWLQISLQIEHSAPVPPTLEIEIELQNTPIKDDAEAEPVRQVPFSVHYFEGDIFVWRSSVKAESDSLGTVSLLKVICWRLRFVNEIRIENVELVPLHNLRRWVVMIVMRLIVFVPLEACLHPVEETRFPWLVFVFPLVVLLRKVDFSVNFIPCHPASVKASLHVTHALGPFPRNKLVVL
mmetsp:Transcript_11247/g.31183  ORF Transcript_11247/g.31183 Transcript_11247/m.31183 type:complete len:202 (+) Transcript_11247:303-908(+)